MLCLAPPEPPSHERAPLREGRKRLTEAQLSGTWTEIRQHGPRRIWTMNHPEDRSKLQIASGAAMGAFETAGWRQKATGSGRGGPGGLLHLQEEGDGSQHGAEQPWLWVLREPGAAFPSAAVRELHRAHPHPDRQLTCRNEVTFLRVSNRSGRVEALLRRLPVS